MPPPEVIGLMEITLGPLTTFAKATDAGDRASMSREPAEVVIGIPNVCEPFVLEIRAETYWLVSVRAFPVKVYPEDPDRRNLPIWSEARLFVTVIAEGGLFVKKA